MSQEQLERTCWRGVQVDCPADWEVSIASGPDEEGRLSFVDRRYLRLDLRWKSLAFAPDLDLLMTKYREPRVTREKIEVLKVSSLPGEWRGVLRKGEESNFLHAGRYFKDAGVLVEATIVWPGRRNLDLECRILNSIAPQDPQASRHHWRALGLDVLAPDEYDLHVNDAKVGRVGWTFAAGAKPRSPRVLAERIAMVDYWLKEPLDKWLVEGLPPRSKVLEQGVTSFNGHEGQRLLSCTKVGTLATLRGRRLLRVDVAWLCPVDGRLYHVAHWKVQRERSLELPAEWKMDCCRQVAALSAAGL